MRYSLNLESWLPHHLHPTIKYVSSSLSSSLSLTSLRSSTLVGLGQSICRPTAPRCDLCDLAPTKLCPSARVVSPKKESPAKKKKWDLMDDEEKEKIRVKEEGNLYRAGGQPKVKVEIEIKVEVKVEGVIKDEE